MSCRGSQQLRSWQTKKFSITWNKYKHSSWMTRQEVLVAHHEWDDIRKHVEQRLATTFGQSTVPCESSERKQFETFVWNKFGLKYSPAFQIKRWLVFSLLFPSAIRRTFSFDPKRVMLHLKLLQKVGRQIALLTKAFHIRVKLAKMNSFRIFFCRNHFSAMHYVQR